MDYLNLEGPRSERCFLDERLCRRRDSSPRLWSEVLGSSGGESLRLQERGYSWSRKKNEDGVNWKDCWHARKKDTFFKLSIAPLGLNPLTADDVYRRHGEWRRTTDDVYRRHLTYRRFSPFVAHSASSRFCSPLGTIPWMSGYKYSAKPRLRSPKASANASRLESEVAVDFAMLVALDSPIDGASQIIFQTTTAATSCLLVSLKVM